MAVSSMNEEGVDFVLDCSGLRCPQPVLRAKKTLTKMLSGQTILVISTDGLAMIDVPHFVATSGHELVSKTEQSGKLLFVIKKA